MQGWSWIRRRARSLPAGAALLATAAIVASAQATTQPAANGPVPVRITHAFVGRPIPQGFLGLSLEYWALPRIAGDPNAVDPVLVRLIGNLSAHPVLRIGGDTTDWTWWPTPGIARPPGIRYSLTPGWFQTARALAQATRARYILGINLEADDTALSVAEAHAVMSGLGRRRVIALELGNEPELYAVRPWYQGPHGGVLGRQPGFDFNAFMGEFSRLRHRLPGVPVAGPDTGNYGWLTPLPRFLAAEPGLAQVTFHRYGLNECVSIPHSPRYPTVPNLLGAFASRELMKGVGTYVTIAHQHHVPFRIDEMNSVTCGGKLGVSNTFSAALWALDALFEMARGGVDGVNIHVPHKWNEPFELHDVGGQWQAIVRPEYYGLMLFAQAAPEGSRLLRILTPGSLVVRSWATLAPDHRVRLLLINHSLTQSGSVSVHQPGLPGPATIERLSAPSAYATGGVTLGGQSFAAHSTTGELAGTAHTQLVRPRTDGTYTITLRPSSAALVTFAGTYTPPAGG